MLGFVLRALARWVAREGDLRAKARNTNPKFYLAQFSKMKRFG